MRRGKEVSQGSHASMAFLTRRIQRVIAQNGPMGGDVTIHISQNEAEWIMANFAKVTLQVEDESALLTVADAGKAAGIETHVVTDSGLTEFHGQPTKTCLALGPDEIGKIDEITKDLKLY